MHLLQSCSYTWAVLRSVCQECLHQQLDIKSLKETETTWTTASGSKAHDSHFLVGTLSTLYLLALLHCALLCLSWYVYVFVCGWLGDHLLSNITCGFSK